ncbi:MAG: cobaltochelatase subunit CobN, partial [Rhizobiales bacterium]|nr:cobaltochelatase subunit CobN [Hyphomicrobiales bacterium]
WARLGAKPAAERRVAIVLSNYPNRASRIGNAVGLDTIASAMALAEALRGAGYAVDGFPGDGAALVDALKKPPTARIAAADYAAFLSGLPEGPRDALGAPPPRDLGVGVLRFGNVAVAVQPSRGGAGKASLHDLDLVPTHDYVAFHAFLRDVFRADAIVHLGKHGSLEWLPGKALALSEACWPELCLGPTPLVYPFIVNDPGEGAQAKRRASAVIVDHLTPPMGRAELHGPLAALETLIDEYALAAGVDRRRRDHLEREIVSLAAAAGLDRDLGLAGDVSGNALEALDAYLCDLKEMQIRDGLHVLGTGPGGGTRVATLVALARAPRTGGRPADASLHRAIAAALGLGAFDPLSPDLAAPWTGPRPEALAMLSDAPWRTAGDTLERIEALAEALVGAAVGACFEARALPEHVRMREEGGLDRRDDRDGANQPRHAELLRGAEPRSMQGIAVPGPTTAAVLDWIAADLALALDASGGAEIAAVLAALDARFVAPGPSGAPSRGRPEVLPTGRNFYTVDIRAVPTAAAWALGRGAADAMALRYFQDEGEWPRSVALTAWGTSNMRTGGDDIATALALVGAEPVWEAGTGRVTGFRILPLADLRRPRIDVTLRISGMFRDAFPEQIALLASAFRAVAALEEDGAANPLAAAARAGEGAARIFGAAPGRYGAGIEAMIEAGAWDGRGDLAEAFLAYGGHAYGGDAGSLEERLRSADAVLQAQDNREHDILDSADYAEFQGGLAAAVAALRGAAPRLYHADNSRPETPVVRSLGEE